MEGYRYRKLVSSRVWGRVISFPPSRTKVTGESVRMVQGRSLARWNARSRPSAAVVLE